MLETNVIVAPNSPSERAKARIAPVTSPGQASGSVTVKKTRARLAPRVRPAASSRVSTASIAWRIARTISGKPMIAAASAAPVQRKAKTRPNGSRSRPIGPSRPKRARSAKPTTTGGSTSGR
jgi:hypothetical protein